MATIIQLIRIILCFPTLKEKRYEAKIEIISKEKYSSSMDSYEITNGLVDNINLWPTIEYGDIHNYCQVHILQRNYEPISV